MPIAKSSVNKAHIKTRLNDILFKLQIQNLYDTKSRDIKPRPLSDYSYKFAEKNPNT